MNLYEIELKPYADYVLTHEDGTKRIGRWNGKATYCNLCSYQTRKVEVVWPLSKITNAKEIIFE